MRRWNTFNIAAHSSFALLASHALAPVFAIPQSWYWSITTLALVLLLIRAAIIAWRENHGYVGVPSATIAPVSSLRPNQQMELANAGLSVAAAMPPRLF